MKRQVRWALSGAMAVLGTWAGRAPASAAPTESPATLKARSDALDQELGQEIRRLQRYLGYENQILGIQVAQGSLAPDAAAARLSQAAAAVYQRSYADPELSTKMAEHQQAAAGFFQAIQTRIAQNAQWPAGRSPDAYRTTAGTELQQIRAQFGQAQSNPTALAPLLSRAAEVLALTKGQSSLPAAQNPFAGSGDRVIAAISAVHARSLAGLSDPAPSPASVVVPTPPAVRTAPVPMVPAISASLPNSPETLLGLGRAANARGDLEGALQAYTALLRLAPNTPNLRTWLAEVCLAKGDFASTQQWLSAELAAQPNSAWALSWLGSLQLATGRQAEASQTFARAAQLDPQVSSYRYQNGGSLLGQNQAARAAGEFLAALALDPRGTGSYNQLGECYALLGQRDLALQYFERYLQYDSTSEWAEKTRQRIAQLRGR